MTNLHLAILSAVLPLAILAGLWFIYRRIRACFTSLATCLLRLDRSLRSHVVDEIDRLHDAVVEHVSGEVGNVADLVAKATDHFIASAEELRTNAERIKAHSQEMHDRAVSRDIAPRQAVTRT